MAQESVSTEVKNAIAQAPVILASASPRRKELLQGIGVPFQIMVPPVDEKELDTTGLSPRDTVIALAKHKGEPVACQHPEALVIAADTIVVWNNEILGKPANREEAFQMLSKLQGSIHLVFSGIAVFYNGEVQADALKTKVRMRPLSPEEIWRYIETNEPMDKAGAYAIQGYGSVLIEWIEGCYFNVVGMSMFLLDTLCRKLGKHLVF